jgi:hypothetical protein
MGSVGLCVGHISQTDMLETPESCDCIYFHSKLQHEGHFILRSTAIAVAISDTTRYCRLYRQFLPELFCDFSLVLIYSMKYLRHAFTCKLSS